ncbi:MAG: ATP-binding protein [Anaerococcus vaginalis]|nr:ATP-binding protein [Anaerococcus vaginalis]
MYTEISKIIEGALSGDKEKVFNYSKILAKNLEVDGDFALSRKINNILSKKRGGMVSLDSISSKPVDGESRMDMVDVCYPNIDIDKLILNNEMNKEIIEFIKSYQNRDKLLKAGIDEPCTLLLYGPPGCGKTTIAQYISMETGLPLITARLDGMISSLLGSTAKNIRKIFDFASRQECILFLDEFDVIAKIRDDKNETGELKRVVNSLIQNIDVFSKDSIIIAATNHHELLDPAIWRRFNRVLSLNKPSECEIKGLIDIFINDSKFKFDITDKKIENIATLLIGLSHSDINTIINNSMRSAVINERNEITLFDILREAFLFKNHMINDETEFIEFLIKGGMTHRELKSCGFPLRRIQMVSKIVRGE